MDFDVDWNCLARRSLLNWWNIAFFRFFSGGGGLNLLCCAIQCMCFLGCAGAVRSVCVPRGFTCNQYFGGHILVGNDAVCSEVMCTLDRHAGGGLHGQFAARSFPNSLDGICDASR